MNDLDALLAEVEDTVGGNNILFSCVHTKLQLKLHSCTRYGTCTAVLQVVTGYMYDNEYLNL